MIVRIYMLNPPYTWVCKDIDVNSSDDYERIAGWQCWSGVVYGCVVETSENDSDQLRLDVSTIIEAHNNVTSIEEALDIVYNWQKGGVM